MINRMYYESRIKGRFGPLAMLSLQKKCVRRNLEAGITSFLFFDRTRVFQVLEGEKDAVDATIQRIANNKLIEEIKVRAIMRCEDRHFTHWPFGATNIDDPDFKRALNACQQTDFFALDVLQAERLLGIVASRKRRAMKVDQYFVSTRNFSNDGPPRGLFSSSSRAILEKKARVFVPQRSDAKVAS